LRGGFVARPSSKNAKRYPDFDAATLRTCARRWSLSLENVPGRKSDYRELLLTDKLYLNGRLAENLWREPFSARRAFQSGCADVSERAGILTHRLPAGEFRLSGYQSPIHRGVLIMRMCWADAPATARAFTPLAADLHPNLTTRQGWPCRRSGVLQRMPRQDQPAGYTLERFDLSGGCGTGERPAHRLPPGATSLAPGQWSGSPARQTSPAMWRGATRRRAFVEKAFHCAGQAAGAAYGPKTLPDLEHAFAGQPTIRELNVRDHGAYGRMTRYNNASPAPSAPVSAKGAGRMRIPKEISMTIQDPPRVSEHAGISAAACRFSITCPVWPRPLPESAASGWSLCSSGWRHSAYLLAGCGGGGVRAQESLKPLEPFKNRMLTLYGVCDRCGAMAMRI